MGKRRSVRAVYRGLAATGALNGIFASSGIDSAGAGASSLLVCSRCAVARFDASSAVSMATAGAGVDSAAAVSGASGRSAASSAGASDSFVSTEPSPLGVCGRSCRTTSSPSRSRAPLSPSGRTGVSFIAREKETYRTRRSLLSRPSRGSQSQRTSRSSRASTSADGARRRARPLRRGRRRRPSARSARSTQCALGRAPCCSDTVTAFLSQQLAFSERHAAQQTHL